MHQYAGITQACNPVAMVSGTIDTPDDTAILKQQKYQPAKFDDLRSCISRCFASGVPNRSRRQAERDRCSSGGPAEESKAFRSYQQHGDAHMAILVCVGVMPNWIRPLGFHKDIVMCELKFERQSPNSRRHVELHLVWAVGDGGQRESERKRLALQRIFMRAGLTGNVMCEGFSPGSPGWGSRPIRRYRLRYRLVERRHSEAPGPEERIRLYAGCYPEP